MLEEFDGKRPKAEARARSATSVKGLSVEFGGGRMSVGGGGEGGDDVKDGCVN